MREMSAPAPRDARSKKPRRIYVYVRGYVLCDSLNRNAKSFLVISKARNSTDECIHVNTWYQVLDNIAYIVLSMSRQDKTRQDSKAPSPHRIAQSLSRMKHGNQGIFL